MSVEQEIRALESRRFQALIDVDLVVLDELLADDMVHHHASGGTDGKASYIEGLKSKKWIYQRIERLVEEIAVFGDTARVSGHVRLTLGNPDGSTRIANNRFLDVWIKRSGKWQVIGWQATPISA